MTSLRSSFHRLAVAGSLLASVFGAPAVASAQSSQSQPQSRIQTEISGQSRVALPGSRSPLARTTTDQGRLSGSTRLSGMTLVFAPSAAQQADLQELLTAQQTKGSPLYQAWLTPEQFAARFGVSDSDLQKAQSWLQQQGFAVESVSRSRTRIRFSGTVAQAETAFGTELHRYNVNGESRYAPATEISLPAALANVTLGIRNLSNIRPHSHLRLHPGAKAPTANFTSSQGSNAHYLEPGDVQTIYDVTPAYNAGFNGAGQSIAVVGQSAVRLSDIEAFQKAAGLTVKDPTLVLMPNTGVATTYTSDEAESDLDLEYAGAMAPGATIQFVYVGDDQNFSVQDAESYAIDNKIAPVVSISYGLCEGMISATDFATQDALYQQAAAQGQTVVAAAGDSGSSDCAASDPNDVSPITPIAGLFVDYPASSAYVTGMGGSEFTAAAVATTNSTYWQPSTGSDVIASAKSYMPEQAWNDSSTSGLSSGGGGISKYSAQPTWQTGVPGITAGKFRLVPDLSLASSPVNAGYLYCSSDTETGVTGSCSNGFRDNTNVGLTVAGGTSFAAPIFSGMVAILNQATGSGGQGLINTRLYTLAANSANYASAFHDITTGNNACIAGYQYCPTTAQGSYSAGTGFDEATGLGSVDFANLLNLWTASSTTTPALAASITTLSAATTTPASGATDVIAITVASNNTGTTAVPTGSVTVTVDDATSTTTANLTGGTASYTFSSTTPGTHTVTVTYGGDGTYAASTASLTLTIPGATVPSASFAVSATNLIVPAGRSGTSTVTVTPAGGYTGTVDWAVAVSPTLTNACYSIANSKVSGTVAVATTLTVYTTASACTGLTPLTVRGGKHAFRVVGSSAAAALHPSQPFNGRGGTMVAFAAVGLFGLVGLRRRSLRGMSLLVLVSVAGMTITGCSSSGDATTGGNSQNAPVGSYSLTLTGTDSASSTLQSAATVTLTID